MQRAREIVQFAIIFLAVVLMHTRSVHAQLKVDSVYSIFVSPHRITDVVSARPHGEYSFLFVEQSPSESRILWKEFSDESGLLEPPIIIYADTGIIRHPFFVETFNYENQIWVRREYMFWEQHSESASGIVIMRRDSARWLPPGSFLPSTFPQTELTVSASWDPSELSLAWIENDSISLVLFGSDSVQFQSRLKLTADRSCRNPTVFDDRNRGLALIVWEERDTSSMLVWASVNKSNYSITMDTLAVGGDNILPRFIANAISGSPAVLWSKRDSITANLYLSEELPFNTYHRPVTQDSVGSNYPGSIFIFPVIFKRGLAKTVAGDVFAYHRVVGDSQAVVRQTATEAIVQYEYWTKKTLFSVDITQGYYFTPIVFWVEQDTAMFSFKGLPTDVNVASSESPEWSLRVPHLDQNFPNPFNPSTIISYQVPVAGHVSLKIFDLLGREVSTVFDDHVEAGTHKVQWNATGLAGGVYVCRLIVGGFAQSKKLLFLK
ncbi:MAG: T9SS type A sorting domain-containing protein [Ignavibacteriales bacterium]|nr:T9SS type A sorting domain-containing protein [Ignavibacteriales bacterium]